MGFNIQELKKASANIQKEFSLSSADASRVVGFYNGGHEVNPDKVQKLLDGDFSDVSGILERLGITGSGSSLNGTKEEKKPKRETPKAKKKEKGARQVSRYKAGRPPRKAFDMMNKAEEITPVVIGEILPRDYMSDILPEGTAERVEGWLGDFSTRHNIDLSRLHSQQWRSACMYIGENIKHSDILRDKEKEKHNGGRVYSGEKLEALLYIWAYFCGVLRQVPLVPDFVSFAGVSRNYFYDFDGQGLSSTAVQILKKAKAIEEGGLDSSVAGGGAGAVGGMFLLKTRHGYSETVTVQHTTTTTALGVSDLPKNLEDYSGKS